MKKEIYYFFFEGLYQFRSSAKLTLEEAGELLDCASGDCDYFISASEIKKLKIKL